eukprot:TRINITY_DN6086_c0_g2_i5.p1 TRINITY_DN6086_c0_g2~~TRINITY_DN6086_c0_g2_i5.p1  ORF type:complete len:353 (-),score=44.73 TRINITY_DN6086_c0_g2_i5:744-1802(-)
MYVSQSIATFFLSSLFGMWADKIGKKNVLVFILLVSLVQITSVLVSVHFKLIWILFLSRLFDLTIGDKICFAYLAEISVESQDRSKKFTFQSVGFSVALIFGPLIGGFLGNYNLIWPIVASAGVTCVNIFFSFFFLKSHQQLETCKNVDESTSNFFSQMKDLLVEIFSRRSWSMLLVLLFFTVVGSQDINEMFFLYAPKRFSLSVFEIGAFAAFIGFQHIFWKLLVFPWILTHVNDSFYLPAATLSSVIGHVGIGILTSVALLCVLFFVTGIGLLKLIVLHSMISLRAKQSQQGTIMGIIGSIHTLAEVKKQSTSSQMEKHLGLCLGLCDLFIYVWRDSKFEECLSVTLVMI